MQYYYKYDPNSNNNVSEKLTIADSQVTLRHIPKKGSVSINNFTETNSLTPKKGYFYINYATGSQYRDSDRLIHFNSADNNKSVTVSYIAVGTPVTAADMVEIKNHLENNAIHGGGSSSGGGGEENPFSIRCLPLDYPPPFSGGDDYMPYLENCWLDGQLSTVDDGGTYYDLFCPPFNSDWRLGDLILVYPRDLYMLYDYESSGRTLIFFKLN